MRRLLVLFALPLLAGCEIFLEPETPKPEEPPPVVRISDRPQTTIAERDRLAAAASTEPDDLAVRYALARSDEQKGLLEEASKGYAAVANGLPPHRYTRAWLSLGRVELALDRPETAEKALLEVLAAVPDDKKSYSINSDYREAALLVAPLLARGDRNDDLVRLRIRFLDELGGTIEEWPLK